MLSFVPPPANITVGPIGRAWPKRHSRHARRLAIVDVASGAQPLSNPHRNAPCGNGEIYNHHILKQNVLQGYPFQTGSDCEVILGLYETHGASLVEHLQGMYAFVIHEPTLVAGWSDATQ